MREAPAYIRRMVREYDRDLGVEWDDEEHVWYLTSGGDRQFSLDHADGTPVRNLDGHGGELLTTLRRSDVRRRGLEVRRRLRTVRAYHAARAAQERERMLGECRAESRGVAKFMRQGPTPMVGGPVLKCERIVA